LIAPLITTALVECSVVSEVIDVNRVKTLATLPKAANVHTAKIKSIEVDSVTNVSSCPSTRPNSAAITTPTAAPAK
jgi:hypothetical protein